jgi:hypothetical protein
MWVGNSDLPSGVLHIPVWIQAYCKSKGLDAEFCGWAVCVFTCRCVGWVGEGGRVRVNVRTEQRTPIDCAGSGPLAIGS